MDDLPIERVNHGGRLILKRDPRYPSTDSRVKGGLFTLSNVRDFTIQAEVEGVDPNASMWFMFDRDENGKTFVKSMYFPTEGASDYAPVIKTTTSVRQPALLNFYITLMTVCVFAAGFFLGTVLSGA